MSSNIEVKSFYVEASNKEELEKLVAETIAANDKKFSTYEIQELDKKKSVEYKVVIKDEKTATGATIEDAIKNAKTAESKMTLKAEIKYAFTKEEMELIKKKEKPSSAAPYEDVLRVTETRF